MLAINPMCTNTRTKYKTAITEFRYIIRTFIIQNNCHVIQSTTADMWIIKHITPKKRAPNCDIYEMVTQMRKAPYYGDEWFNCWDSSTAMFINCTLIRNSCCGWWMKMIRAFKSLHFGNGSVFDIIVGVVNLAKYEYSKCFACNNCALIRETCWFSCLGI